MAHVEYCLFYYGHMVGRNVVVCHVCAGIDRDLHAANDLCSKFVRLTRPESGDQERRIMIEGLIINQNTPLLARDATLPLPILRPPPPRTQT